MIMSISFSGSFAVYSINAERTVNKIFSSHLSQLNKTTKKPAWPRGVFCAEIDAKCEYLVIGSFTSAAASSTDGLSVWRVLNHEPWIAQFDTSAGAEPSPGNNKVRPSPTNNNSFIYLTY